MSLYPSSYRDDDGEYVYSSDDPEHTFFDDSPSYKWDWQWACKDCNTLHKACPLPCDFIHQDDHKLCAAIKRRMDEYDKMEFITDTKWIKNFSNMWGFWMHRNPHRGRSTRRARSGGVPGLSVCGSCAAQVDRVITGSGWANRTRSRRPGSRPDRR